VYPSKVTSVLLKETLVVTNGNITHAATILEISKVHAMRLTEKHNLRVFANALRRKIGRSATGRPKMDAANLLS
jgi:hypothetical protein